MRLHKALLWALAISLVGCSKNTAPSQIAAPPAPQAQTNQASSNQGVQGSAGVVQNVRQAAKRAADGGELHNFALAYIQFASLGGRGPSKVEDLKESLTSKTVEAFKDNNVYGVNWRIQNPSANSVLAYAKEPDVYGTRLVAKGDGSVVRMSKEEFDKANSGR